MPLVLFLGRCFATRRRIAAPKKHKSTRAIRLKRIALTIIFGGFPMQHEANKLQPAQAEVHSTAHDQDLIEVPRRARLDREAENHEIQPTRTKLEKN
jgi:hypothetical protein